MNKNKLGAAIITALALVIMPISSIAAVAATEYKTKTSTTDSTMTANCKANIKKSNCNC